MINFDVLYKKKLETDSIKLLGESQLRQLKLMICGKYQIYDLTHLFIYYKNSKITSNDNTKLKEIFKTKKAKIEITEKEKKSDNNDVYTINFKTLCKCGNAPSYICEKCEEFLCDYCLKKKKHITHDKNIVKLSEYSTYIKKYLKDLANELDSKILNDEAYKFLKYWDYDKDKEIKTINNLYDFIKEQIEDIKQLQIDYIINLSEGNKYNELKMKLQNTLSDYTSFNLDNDMEKIIEQKRNLLQNSQNVLMFYNEIKMELLKYTKTIKELQWFNQEFQKYIQNKFNMTKKKYSENNGYNFNLNSSSSYNNFNMTINNDNNNENNNLNHNKVLSSNASMDNLNNSGMVINVRTTDKFPKKSKSKNKIGNKAKTKTPTSISLSPIVDKDSSPEKNKESEKDKEKEKEFEQLSKTLLSTTSVNHNNRIMNFNSASSTPMLNTSHSNGNYNTLTNKSNNLLLKLKDTRKILIFNPNTQIFKEKIYYDKGNFRKELTSEADVIQLNLYNNLYMLSGKQSNKFYYYNYSINSVLYINNCLYSHFYGVMIFCKKNNYIYLLGGNSQTNCEMYYLPSTHTDKSKNKGWKSLPSLNEERQEFAAMIYNDDYLYVFFGFSHIKGINLSSIERMNINAHDRFEVVYVNEQITLSSIGCALFNDESEDSSKGILLLGGFDGEKYIESTLIFSPEQMKIRECDIIIPNISKHFQFLFHLETNFIQMDNNLQVVFDMKNNAHILSNHSYELFSEIE